MLPSSRTLLPWWIQWEGDAHMLVPVPTVLPVAAAERGALRLRSACGPGFPHDVTIAPVPSPHAATQLGPHAIGVPV